jgi:hypothetical protein
VSYRFVPSIRPEICKQFKDEMISCVDRRHLNQDPRLAPAGKHSVYIGENPLFLDRLILRLTPRVKLGGSIRRPLLLRGPSVVPSFRHPSARPSVRRGSIRGRWGLPPTGNESDRLAESLTGILFPGFWIPTGRVRPRSAPSLRNPARYY